MVNNEGSIESYISNFGTSHEFESVAYFKGRGFNDDQISALKQAKMSGVSVSLLTQMAHSYITTDVMKAGGIINDIKG